MRKISFNLDPRDIRDLANELRRYAKEMQDMADDVTVRLSEVAADEARSHYSSDVTVEATSNGVTATGESVVFEEFGAGARISDPFPGGADVSFEIRRGAYSDLNEGEYARTGYDHWHHDGQIYQYVTPTNALFYGMERAKEEAARVAREVFSQDD